MSKPTLILDRGGRICVLTEIYPKGKGHFIVQKEKREEVKSI